MKGGWVAEFKYKAKSISWAINITWLVLLALFYYIAATVDQTGYGMSGYLFFIGLSFIISKRLAKWSSFFKWIYWFCCLCLFPNRPFNHLAVGWVFLLLCLGSIINIS
ncbi:hypothetical protein SAMN02745216_01590 [Desulfatibacillum alkenivorans DSM 16219]|uniref:Uncharacterized protein n=1 Tax=Desulfatibacillum alkenivorans DSM 16219 TaxID=1121393 RepID=A0A1M6J152_9BACT|nr:hypothetical protein SAMN02745216_01590 [Desulfatibacillum alkenivorans DSM 16219]